MVVIMRLTVTRGLSLTSRVRPVVDKSRKLPDGHSRDEGEEQDHRLCPQETGHDNSHEDDGCDSSYNEIIHLLPPFLLVCLCQ